MGLTPIGCSYTLGFVLVEACWWLSEAAPNSKISSLYRPASKTYMPSAACTYAIVNCTTSAIFIHNVLILPDFFRFFVFKIFILKYFGVTLALRPSLRPPTVRWSVIHAVSTQTIPDLPSFLLFILKFYEFRARFVIQPLFPLIPACHL